MNNKYFNVSAKTTPRSWRWRADERRALVVSSNNQKDVYHILNLLTRFSTRLTRSGFRDVALICAHAVWITLTTLVLSMIKPLPLFTPPHSILTKCQCPFTRWRENSRQSSRYIGHAIAHPNFLSLQSQPCHWHLSADRRWSRVNLINSAYHIDTTLNARSNRCPSRLSSKNIQTHFVFLIQT